MSAVPEASRNTATIVKLPLRNVKRAFSGRTKPGLPADAQDPVVADGLILMRSFMAIDDADMRASIIGIVEKIARQTPLFRNAPLK
jgi:hypothetical protein